MTRDTQLDGYQADLHAPITRCEIEHLGKDVQCPDLVTHVIVNLQEAGYIPICEIAAGFFYADQFKMALMTVEEFEWQRAKGLYVDHMTPIPQTTDVTSDANNAVGN